MNKQIFPPCGFDLRIFLKTTNNLFFFKFWSVTGPMCNAYALQ
jgi:hypothetical protein